MKEKILLQENINIDPILFRGKVASTGRCGLFFFLNQFTEVTDGVSTRETVFHFIKSNQVNHQQFDRKQKFCHPSPGTHSFNS